MEKIELAALPLSKAPPIKALGCKMVLYQLSPFWIFITVNMNHEKLNNPFMSGSSQGYPPNTDYSSSMGDSMQQQTYSPPSGPPPQNSFHSERLPPAYDSAPNTGIPANSTIILNK
jgi:hypothetical protein